MIQRITPKSTSKVQAMALPIDNEDFFGQVREQQSSGYSFYPWAVALRLGLLGVLLFNAFAIWFS